MAINEKEKQFFGEIWQYRSDGLVPLDTKDPLNMIPGTVKILDLNGYLTDTNGNRVLDDKGKPQYSGKPDGKIDAADLALVGVNTPYTIGLSNIFNYKRFDLSVFTYSMLNRWKNNDIKGQFGGGSVHTIVNPSLNLERSVLERWNSDYQNGKDPSSSQTFAQYGTGDFYLENAWFVRIKNITLGYTLPKFYGLKNLRLYCNLINPFVFTPYSGMDPETENYIGAYPNQRSYIFGVELNF